MALSISRTGKDGYKIVSWDLVRSQGSGIECVKGVINGGIQLLHSGLTALWPYNSKNSDSPVDLWGLVRYAMSGWWRSLVSDHRPNLLSTLMKEVWEVTTHTAYQVDDDDYKSELVNELSGNCPGMRFRISKEAELPIWSPCQAQKFLSWWQVVVWTNWQESKLFQVLIGCWKYFQMVSLFNQFTVPMTILSELIWTEWLCVGEFACMMSLG